MTPAAQLDTGLAALGLDLPPAARGRLLDYVALLAKWNQAYNLTAVREPERMVSHHLLDSLAVAPFLPTGRLLDVGSGAGLPGVPLALARPDLEITVLDSNSKKTAFVEQARVTLGISNLAVATARIEAFRPAAPYPAIISRALSDLKEFVVLSRPLLAPGGRWYAMKGLYPHEEIAQLPAGVKLVARHELAVPGVEGARHLIVLEAAA
jgi:16S rRNA (guanine527-N7)-methyltransferase